MIRFKNVCFAYASGSQKKTVENLNFNIKDSGITAIIAPSGAGKTTILKLIAGLLKPDSGEILFDKEDIKISYDFQDYRLLPWYSVLKNISIVTDRSLDEIKEYLLKLNINENLWEKHPGELSGGEQRRVCLIKALLFDGDVLLLDEPFNGLDSENRQNAVNLVKEFSKTKAVVLVSHIAEDIELADTEIKL